MVDGWKRWTRLAVLCACLGWVFTGCGGDDGASGGGEATSTGGEEGSTEEGTGEEGDALAEETGEGTGAPCPADERTFCETCECDEECGDGGVCAKEGEGPGFCSRLCSVAQNNCDPGSYCKQFGNTALSFYCAPEAGTCDSDGLACAACAEDADCGEGFGCHASASGAKWCFESCDPENPDSCGSDHECNRKEELCFPEVKGKFQAVCHANQKTLCEPCGYTYDCAEGLACVEGNGSDLFCSMSCTKFNGVDSTCPEGLFCNGDYCKPPIASLCQGWLICGASNVCDEGEVCEQGVCRLTCEGISDCPLGQKCSTDGYCEPL